MTNDSQAASSWWGDFTFDSGQCRQWHIGPLTLIVRRLNGEWQIAHERMQELDNNHVSWHITDTDQLPESLSDNSRYVFRDTSGQLNITPMLADRPIISRPLTPFNLTAGEEVILYVSMPLWLQLAVGSSPHKALKVIAIQRPSDTWFGSSTLEGELCYASNTHCRLNLDELPQRPHRAITPVLIINHADTTLSLERLNLPAPLLHLYASSNGQLWTPQVTLIREKDGDMAELKIDNKPPEEAEQAVQLSEPRNKADSSVIFRAFNAVFS
ncbi:MAG: hypothetical protein ACN4GM_11380 [Gammaproteobacteria bacterium]